MDLTEITNELINKVLNRGRTLSGLSIDYGRELFMAALLSDHYLEDFNRIMDLLIAGIPASNENLVEFNKVRQEASLLTTQRNGANQHRVRAQLEGLKRDNVIFRGHNLADVIVDFILKEYAMTDLIQVYSLWRTFYTKVFQSFLNIRNQATFQTAISEFEKFEPLLQKGADLVKTDALLMDAYTLARMFRKFTTSQHERPTHNPSDLVITYTGALHTETYAKFFTEVLQIRPVDFRSNPISQTSRELQEISRCLHDDNFSRYFETQNL